MAIQGIEQPAVIEVDEFLRLRKFDGIYDFALEWDPAYRGKQIGQKVIAALIQ